MKRIMLVLPMLLLLALLFTVLPTSAQQPPTLTPTRNLITATPTLAPTTLAEGVLREIERSNQEATRQIAGANTVLSLVQSVIVLLVVLAVLVALFGIVIFLEYRANLGKARELLGQVVDETKQMRVVQEAVKIRLGDMETLNQKVNDTLQTMQDDLRSELHLISETNDRQVKDIQDVMNSRLHDLESARIEVSETSQTMRNQIRDQLQVVYDRGDRQMKALMDVLNAQIRDITAMHQQVDATSQEVRNQVRDQLQVVFERGDKQVRDLLDLHNKHRTEVDGTRREMLNISQTMRDQIRDGLLKIYERGDEQMKTLTNALDSHLKEFETLRGEIETASQQLHTRIEQELDAANDSIGELELIHAGVDQSLQMVQTQLDQGLKKVVERADKSAQALGMMQLAQPQLRQGDLQGALENLQQAAAFDPESRAIHYLLGDAYVRQGDLTNGAEHLRQAGAGTGDHLASDALYAYTLRLQGDAAENPAERERLHSLSAAMFLKALEKNPRLLDANGESVFGALGSLYRRQGHMPQALAFYEQARKITPQNSYPLNNLAILEWMQGNRAKAIELFEHSLDLASQKLDVDQTNYWTWFDRITAEVALEKSPDEIARHLEIATNLTRELDALPLHKLLDGLEELARVPDPPANIAQVLTRLTQAIDSRHNNRVHTH